MEKIFLIPCSGIGKCLGSITREAAYLVAEDRLPEKSEVVSLSKMMMDDDTQRKVSGGKVITLDGCTLACATKTAGEQGAKVILSIAAMDSLRKHKGLKPAGIDQLNADAVTLARKIADEVCEFMQTKKD